MTRPLRYHAIALAIVLIAVVALPFHIAGMEWVLQKGDLLLSICGQLLSGGSGPEAATPPR